MSYLELPCKEWTWHQVLSLNIVYIFENKKKKKQKKKKLANTRQQYPPYKTGNRLKNCRQSFRGFHMAYADGKRLDQIADFHFKTYPEEHGVVHFISVVFSNSCLLAYTPYNNNIITRTYLYNFDPLKPHFYIVKLGFTGVFIIFLIYAQNIDCGYSLEPPRRGGSNQYPQSMFWTEIRKNIRIFYLKAFSFWWWNFQYIWIGVFS